jgi:L,D-transpeptidase catalytic domain/Putative peptidoglycan binding domain
MRRLATAAVLPCSVALFIVLAPIAAADETTPSTTTAPTTTTEPGDTTTAPPTTTFPVPRGPKLIQPGVTIGGLLVGGLTKAEARELVEQRFGKPITLVVSPSKKMRVTPDELGADAYVAKAVTTAVRVRSEGFKVPLTVDVVNGKLKRFLGDLAKRTDREPVDASLTLRNFAPVAHPSAPGRRLMQTVAARQVSLAIRKHERSLELPFQELDPKVTEADLGKVIVIKRGSNQLLYYNGDRLKRTFRVATGQSSYPTPLGHYEIVTMQRNPWWYPPEGSAWAEGAKPVPPGPGNPLGTRWMGISSPYVGIHGTPDAASIGYSASHGCIRMLIPQVEWLFQQVDVGTPVFIVPA